MKHMSDKKVIITLGRECGSGGHEIGEKLSKKLGIAFYDKNLIELAAKHSGLDLNVLGATDEKAPSQLYRAQSDVIRDLSEKESFVIVGRCSNSVLEDREDVLNVFVYAPLRNRVHRVMERHLIDSEDKARKEVLRTDKIRRTYYQYYSEYRWGEHESYDLMIDSSVFGIDGSVDVIVDAINRKFR